MRATVYLNQPLTQDRYGLHFDRGEAHTDNEYLIKKLQSKGVRVEIEKEETKLILKEKTIDEMTVAELKEYATTKNIEIPSIVKNKADIIEFIKSHKESDEKDNPEGQDGEEHNPEGQNGGNPEETTG